MRTLEFSVQYEIEELELDFIKGKCLRGFRKKFTERRMSGLSKFSIGR
jgi:hypothetical protein